MELVKNIFFNTDKLVENSTVKISYAGYLFQKGVDEVYIHYGFGTDWPNSDEIKMVKTELGFQCEVNILGQNFSFPVEAVEVTTEETPLALVTTPETGMQVHKGLRKTYIWSKKVKLAIYKIIHYVPRLISGNYRRKVEE